MKTFVHMVDGQLGPNIDLMIDFRFETVARGLPILRHHDDGCLKSGEHGKDELS